jgi:hypothetical protein
LGFSAQNVDTWPAWNGCKVSGEEIAYIEALEFVTKRRRGHSRLLREEKWSGVVTAVTPPKPIADHSSFL